MASSLERLRDGDHLAVAHERLDDLGRRDAEELGEVLDGGPGRDLDDRPSGRPAAPAARRRGRRRPRRPRRWRPPPVGAAAPRGAGVDDDAAALAAGVPADARPGRRGRRVRLLDDLFVDRDFAVDDLDAGLLEVGENVVDARPALAGDIADFALSRHSPHHLSLVAGRGERADELVVDGRRTAEGAPEGAPFAGRRRGSPGRTEIGAASGRARPCQAHPAGLDVQSYQVGLRTFAPAADAAPLRAVHASLRGVLVGRLGRARSLGRRPASAAAWAASSSSLGT